MTLTPVPVESFGGLNLVDDPGTVGWAAALDILNVDVKPGRLPSRSGYALFTAAAATAAYHSLAPFYTTGGTKQLLAAFGGGTGAINALNTSGAIVAAQAFANSTYASVARFAAPGSEHAYVAVSGSGAATVYRWDGAAWSTPAWTGTTPTGRHLAATSDNRLANARRNGTTAGDNPSTVFFSDAGVPTTWTATNYVDISPGDGEEIMALVAWGDSLFAFKQTKFAVFYGNSTDGSGNPIFNHRLVNSAGLAPSVGGSTAYRAITTSPKGIYFANRRGIWLTTGGPAELISRKVDPIFTGETIAFGPSALNQAHVDSCALVWHDEKLWLAYPSGSSTANDRILRFDPVTDSWTLYDITASALASFRIGNSEELVFGVGAAVNLPAPSGVAATASTLGGTFATATTRYYVITALNAAGETTASSEVSRTTPLDAPTGVTRTDNGGSCPTRGSGSANWLFRVAALDAAGQEGVISAATSTGGAGDVQTQLVTWNAVAGAAGYRLYIQTTGTHPANTLLSGAAYLDVGNVTSYIDDGTGPTWTTGGWSAGTATTCSITLTWAAVSGATSYRIYRGTSAAGESVYFAPGNVVTYTDTGSAGTAGTPPVSNTAAVASFDIGRHSSAYTSDGGNGTSTGAPITWRYRAGFSDLGTADMKRIHSWRLQGSGAPTLKLSTDFGALETGATVTLGTAPAVAEGVRRYAPRGRQFSWQVGGTSAASLNSLVANVAGKRGSGEHSSS